MDILDKLESQKHCAQPPAAQHTMYHYDNYLRIGSQTRKDYLRWSIFNMFCCCFCWPFAIPAMIYSTLAWQRDRENDVHATEHYTRRAYRFNMVTTVLGAGVLAGCMLFVAWQWTFNETFEKELSNQTITK